MSGMVSFMSVAYAGGDWLAETTISARFADIYILNIYIHINDVVFESFNVL